MNYFKTLWVKKEILLVLLITTLSLTFCIKDEINLDNISDNIELNYGFAGPLAYGELNLKDILESVNANNEIKMYPEDSLLYLVYKDEIISKKAEDFIMIPDQHIQKSVPAGDPYMPISVSGVGLDTTIVTYFDYTVSNGELIDSMFLKAGSLDVQITSTVPKTGVLKFILPEVTKNGVPLTISTSITVGSGNYVSPVITELLQGYKLKLESGNKLKVIYNIHFNSAGSISSGNSISFDANITGLKYSFLYGYVSQQILIPTQTGNVNIAVFDITEESAVKFYDPRIRFFVCNTFGVPFQADLSNTKTYSKLNNVYFNLNFANTFKFNSAISTEECTDDTIYFNRDNSNLGGAIATTPSSMSYNLKVTSNPDGPAKNFIADNSEFKVNTEVEFPFYFKATRYEYTDTIAFDIFKDVKDMSIIKKFALYDSIENWFPFEVETQIVFVDSNGLAVDTLYGANKQPFIKAGTVGSEGRIITPARYSDVEEYTTDDAIKFKNVRKALLNVAVFTKGYDTDKYVKVYYNDKIKIHLGIYTNVKLTSFDQL